MHSNGLFEDVTEWFLENHRALGNRWTAEYRARAILKIVFAHLLANGHGDAIEQYSFIPRDEVEKACREYLDEYKAWPAAAE